MTQPYIAVVILMCRNCCFQMREYMVFCLRFLSILQMISTIITSNLIQQLLSLVHNACSSNPKISTMIVRCCSFVSTILIIMSECIQRHSWNSKFFLVIYHIEVATQFTLLLYTSATLTFQDYQILQCVFPILLVEINRIRVSTFTSTTFHLDFLDS